MKRAFLILAVILFMSGAFSVSYGQSSDKSSKTNENMKEAKKDSIEFAKFKRDVKKKIKSYDKSIADLKVKIEKEGKKTSAKYKKQLAELEKESEDLRKQIDNYVDEGKVKWKSFKVKFNHDMDKLGKDINDLVNNNK